MACALERDGDAALVATALRRARGLARGPPADARRCCDLLAARRCSAPAARTARRRHARAASAVGRAARAIRRCWRRSSAVARRAVRPPRRRRAAPCAARDRRRRRTRRAAWDNLGLACATCARRRRRRARSSAPSTLRSGAHARACEPRQHAARQLPLGRGRARASALLAHARRPRAPTRGWRRSSRSRCARRRSSSSPIARRWSRARAAAGRRSRRSSRRAARACASATCRRDFHEHATAHLIAGLFERHDRARVEIFALRYGPRRRQRDAPRAARARSSIGATSRALERRAMPRSASRADGSTCWSTSRATRSGSRLGILARRPAPVQLHYLGFPGHARLRRASTASSPTRSSCRPAASAASRERVLRLPRCYQVNDATRRRCRRRRRARALGLPERRARARVLQPDVQAHARRSVAIWLDALRAHRDAVLWLHAPHALARRNLRARGGARGRRRRAHRVRAGASPQAEHLARLRCADLALDVLPYGSHTTGSDALWAGVPLLTCRGHHVRRARRREPAATRSGCRSSSPSSLDGVSRRCSTLCAPTASGSRDYRAHLERERQRAAAVRHRPAFTRDFERLLGARAATMRRARLTRARLPSAAQSRLRSISSIL